MYLPFCHWQFVFAASSVGAAGRPIGVGVEVGLAVGDGERVGVGVGLGVGVGDGRIQPGRLGYLRQMYSKVRPGPGSRPRTVTEAVTAIMAMTPKIISRWTAPLFILKLLCQEEYGIVNFSRMLSWQRR